MEGRDGGGGRNRCSQGQSRKWRRNGQSGIFTAVLFFAKRGQNCFCGSLTGKKAAKKKLSVPFSALIMQCAFRPNPAANAFQTPSSRCYSTAFGVIYFPFPPLASVAASQASAKSRVNIGGPPIPPPRGEKARMKAEGDTRKIPRKARFFQRLGRIRRALMEAPSVKR